MQVRYQAALRPEGADYSRGASASLVQGRGAGLFAGERINDRAKLLADLRHVDLAVAIALRSGATSTLCGFGTRCLAALRIHIIQAVARAADGEAFFVKQFADAADEQDFVMLVVAPVAAPLDGLELRELLLPIPEHVRFDAAQLAHL